MLDRLGKAVADAIDWSGPRLLCIAGGFTRYDEHAVQQMRRNIELIRHRRFGDELLLFELVNATAADGVPVIASVAAGVGSDRAMADKIASLQGPLRDLYEELRSYLMALGDDVQEKVLKYYVAFKRIKNFACIDIHPVKGSLTVSVKLDPRAVQLEPGFTRDVSNIGIYGTGDVEISLRSRVDLEKAKSLLQQSYEAS